MTLFTERAFETVFLDRSPHRTRFDEAYRVLSGIDGDELTQIALKILPHSGPKPSTLPSEGSVLWFRRGNSTRRGWQFLVASPLEHS